MTLSSQPLIAPLHQSDNDRSEGLSFLRKSITQATPILVILQTTQYSLLDQASKTRGEDVGCDAEGREETIKCIHPANRISHDKQRPPIANLVKGTRDGAV
jgi:hypothetical protein